LWGKYLAQSKDLSPESVAVAPLDQSSVAPLDQSSNIEVRIFDVLAKQNKSIWSTRPVVISEAHPSLIQKNSLRVRIPDVESKPQKSYKFKKMDLDRLLTLQDRFISKINEQDTIRPPEISLEDDIVLDEMAKPFILTSGLIAPVDAKKTLLEKSFVDQDDE
jgi:hypothetical protein